MSYQILSSEKEGVISKGFRKEWRRLISGIQRKCFWPIAIHIEYHSRQNMPFGLENMFIVYADDPAQSYSRILLL